MMPHGVADDRHEAEQRVRDPITIFVPGMRIALSSSIASASSRAIEFFERRVRGDAGRSRAVACSARSAEGCGHFRFLNLVAYEMGMSDGKHSSGIKGSSRRGLCASGSGARAFRCLPSGSALKIVAEHIALFVDRCDDEARRNAEADECRFRELQACLDRFGHRVGNADFVEVPRVVRVLGARDDDEFRITRSERLHDGVDFGLRTDRDDRGLGRVESAIPQKIELAHVSEIDRFAVSPCVRDEARLAIDGDEGDAVLGQHFADELADAAVADDQALTFVSLAGINASAGSTAAGGVFRRASQRPNLAVAGISAIVSETDVSRTTVSSRVINP